MFSKAWDFASFLLYAICMPSVCHPSVQRAPNHLGGKGPRKVGDADAARIAHAFDNQRIGGAGGGGDAQRLGHDLCHRGFAALPLVR